MAHAGSLRALSAGFVAGGLVLLLAACGGSPKNGVASLNSGNTTTTAQSAPAATGGGAGGSASAGNGGPGGGEHMVMSGGNYTDMLKYARCMRSHGVPDFPDPSSSGSISFGSANGIDPQSPQFQAADKTCRELLPNGGQPTPAQRAQALAQALKFSQCMRAHGIGDFPDPQSSGGGIQIRLRGGPGSDLNPDNPQFQAAQKACQGFMPGPKNGG